MRLQTIFTVGISTAALIVSTATAYYTTFRYNDDVRVMFGRMPDIAYDFEKKRFSTEGVLEGRFINSGNRLGSVGPIELLIVQPRARDQVIDSCRSTNVGYTRLEDRSVSVKPGEIHVATFEAKLPNARWKGTAALVEENLMPDDGSHSVMLCVLVRVTTPDKEKSTMLPLRRYSFYNRHWRIFPELLAKRGTSYPLFKEAGFIFAKN